MARFLRRMIVTEALFTFDLIGGACYYTGNNRPAKATDEPRPIELKPFHKGTETMKTCTKETLAGIGIIVAFVIVLACVLSPFWGLSEKFWRWI